MPTISIRALADGASRVVKEVQEGRRPFIVTNRGEPVAAIIPIDAAGLNEALEDWVLASAAGYVADMHEADEDLAAGRTVSLDKVLADLDAEGDTDPH